MAVVRVLYRMDQNRCVYHHPIFDTTNCVHRIVYSKTEIYTIAYLPVLAYMYFALWWLHCGCAAEVPRKSHYAIRAS